MPIDTSKDSWDYHPDFSANYAFVREWLTDIDFDMPQAHFPDGRVFGMTAKLLSSHYFRNNLLTFFVSFPPDHPHRARYANNVNLNKDNASFKEEARKTFEVMKAMTKKLWGKEYKALPPPSFATPPSNMAEAMNILSTKFVQKRSA